MDIKSLRIKRGLTQEELAKKLNINSCTISRIETRKQSPSVKTLKKIAKEFGVSIEELTNEDERHQITIVGDKKIEEWIRKQSNISYSLKLLMKRAIRDYGYIDIQKIVLILE